MRGCMLRIEFERRSLCSARPILACLGSLAFGAKLRALAITTPSSCFRIVIAEKEENEDRWRQYMACMISGFSGTSTPDRVRTGNGLSFRYPCCGPIAPRSSPQHHVLPHAHSRLLKLSRDSQSRTRTVEVVCTKVISFPRDSSIWTHSLEPYCSVSSPSKCEFSRNLAVSTS